jgi:hypothetical protein
VVHRIEIPWQAAMLQGEGSGRLREQGPTLTHPNCHLLWLGGGPNSRWWRFMEMDSASDTGIYRTMILAVEEDAVAIVAA